MTTETNSDSNVSGPDRSELGEECDVDDCENRLVGIEDGWEFSRGLVCADCIDYQRKHGHWPDETEAIHA